MCKADIADGFYRLHLAPGDILALGVAFPPAPDGTPLIAFPLTCPMGWVESPPWFSVLAVCAIRLNGQTDRVIRTVRIAIRTRTVAIPQ
jgi:hypothetical protein